MVKRPKVATIQRIVTPIYDGLALTSDEWDQLSATLTDYLSFSHTHVTVLESAKALAALELLNKWRSQAADLRDKIEARD